MSNLKLIENDAFYNTKFDDEIFFKVRIFLLLDVEFYFYSVCVCVF